MNHLTMFHVVQALCGLLTEGHTTDNGDFVIPARPGEGRVTEIPAVRRAREALENFKEASVVTNLRTVGELNLYARIYTGDLVQITAIGPAEPPEAVNRFMAADDSQAVLGIVGNVALLARKTDGGTPMSKLVGKHPLTGNLPTDYRVQWEVDAFDATTPEEAAREAFDNMQRVGTHATCFKVLGNDGSTTMVDLMELDAET